MFQHLLTTRPLSQRKNQIHLRCQRSILAKGTQLVIQSKKENEKDINSLHRDVKHMVYGICYAPVGNSGFAFSKTSVDANNNI